MTQDAGALLIVDDNENNRDMLAARLQRLGYGDLAMAVDGREALALLGQRRFDLVLLDVMMPVLNGYLPVSATPDRGGGSLIGNGTFG